MDQRLPFPVSSRPWNELSAQERSFFCGEGYLPLPANHAAQIRLLISKDASRLAAWAWSAIPPGWPEGGEGRFRCEETLDVSDCWNDEAAKDSVRRWLFDRGIPYQRIVYLMYERDRVVQTTWRMVVRYWDAFAWSVGYAMMAVDHTLQWVGCFHHENVFVFGSQPGFSWQGIQCKRSDRPDIQQ